MTIITVAPATPLVVLAHLLLTTKMYITLPTVPNVDPTTTNMTALKRDKSVVVRVKNVTKIIGLSVQLLRVIAAGKKSTIIPRGTVGITLGTTRRAISVPRESIPLPPATAPTALLESTKMEPALGATFAARESTALRVPRAAQTAPLERNSLITLVTKTITITRTIVPIALRGKYLAPERLVVAIALQENIPATR